MSGICAWAQQSHKRPAAYGCKNRMANMEESVAWTPLETESFRRCFFQEYLIVK